MHFLRGSSPPMLAMLLMACGSEPTVTPLDAPVQLPVTSTAALVPLDPFGIGARIPGSRGCQAPEYRQFDFWVGKWDAYGYPTGTALLGTNVITSVLDGCAVLESWTSGNGGRGRSLNVYDASTGRWSQMWVGGGGCPFANIFVEGGLENGVMIMTGSREQPLGFFITQCPGAGSVVFAHTDRIHWTPLPGGEVLQQSVFANNNDPVPGITPPPAGSGLRYVPVTNVTTIPIWEQPSFCQFRLAARHFDFMVGTWDVHQGNGQGAQGTATFSKDITNCLLEETFEGPDGYEGLSFNTFDAFTQKWYRTYVDNDGQRILMTGTLLNGSMVLTGTKAGSAGRSVEVRITWTPVSVDRVEQHWEYSRDQGTTWKSGQDIVFTRHQP